MPSYRSYRSYHINNSYQHPIPPFPSEFPKADRIGDVQKPGWHDHVWPRRAAVAIPAVTLSTHYSPPWAMASGMHRLQHSNHLTGRANSNHWILHPGPQRAGATIRLQWMSFWLILALHARWNTKQTSSRQKYVCPHTIEWRLPYDRVNTKRIINIR